MSRLTISPDSDSADSSNAFIAASVAFLASSSSWASARAAPPTAWPALDELKKPVSPWTPFWNNASAPNSFVKLSATPLPKLAHFRPSSAILFIATSKTSWRAAASQVERNISKSEAPPLSMQSIAPSMPLPIAASGMKKKSLMPAVAIEQPIDRPASSHELFQSFTVMRTASQYCSSRLKYASMTAWAGPVSPLARRRKAPVTRM